MNRCIVPGLIVFVTAAVATGVAQQPRAQAVDANGAPLFRVDPFWPKPLPNRWSMQQVTGIHVDHEDHIWFLNRAAAAEGDEIGGDGNPPRIDCCVRGPEVIELDQQGSVVRAWGGPGFHPLWPTALQTVIADSKGFVWVGGTAPQDSILKFTRDGQFVWDFGHRPPQGAPLAENNQQTDVLGSKGRFQIDEVAGEIYIINLKRVLVYDMNTGAFKRGWGGHGMPLSEISNDPIPPYTWTGGPPPEEKNFVPDLHFVEISQDRRVYIGERGQNRIQVFTTDGKFLQEFSVAAGTPARGEGCGGLNNTKMPPCGTTYKLAISRDPAQMYLYVADGTNNRVWILDRQSGKTLGSFGGNGRYAGQLHWINAIAMDSRGNIYTGEVEQAKRIQKFEPVIASPSAAGRRTIGLTARDAPIDALVVPGASDSAPTVLLVGGLQGSDASVDIVRQEAAAFETQAPARRSFRLIAIPLSNPDGVALQFPPAGTAYRENTESHVLWRWIGIQAPDLVVIVGNGGAALAASLSQQTAGLVGTVPSRTVPVQSGILASLSTPIPASDARRERDRRRSRTPRALAGELAQVYGRDFSQPTYILAVALVAQIQLGNTADVLRLAEPYLNGSQDPFAKPSQSSLAAHLLFYEIARRTGDARARALVLRAANSGFTDDGTLREFMPLHGGWSDSVFMDIPILAKAGALSGDRRYLDMAARHFAFMQTIVRRADGLYRHQASSDAAWGRGNGFPALGLALTLDAFPQDHPGYSTLRAAFQRHMSALAPLQDEHGMFREVLDVPGAYSEYSGTAMIATAMIRGIRKGWLDAATYQPIVDRAWQAILVRTASDGRLFDVAESTGTRGLTEKDYLRRAAILDIDPRGGAFALLFATEMAGLAAD